MGVVYEAVQDTPRRHVALKVISSHQASGQGIARFQQEAEILGQLRHPGIAQVYDAGSVDSGDGARPFLSMELIDGTSLTEFANDNGLDVEARLNLIADVCDAVHYAHEQGVIHRDLKPENVMVTKRGDTKVLDFGIARMTHDGSSGEGNMTVEGQIMGTLNSMSPEQLSGRVKTIDRRTDVYALGVMLYETVSGRKPHDLRNCSLTDAARIISTEPAAPLSTIEPNLRGDVSTIASKAMEKEMSRRYQTAADLGADILRFLRHEPITARPQSRLYRGRKFVQRHRPVVVGVTLAFLALLIGTGVATGQAVLAKRAQTAAEISEASTGAVTDFLIKEILTADTADNASGEGATLAGAFQRAASRIHLLDDEPLIQANIHHLLGLSFLNIGDFGSASSHFSDAFTTRTRLLGESHRDSIESLIGICSARKRIPPIDDVLPLQIRAYELARDAFGPLDEQTLTAMNNVGSLYNRMSRWEDSVTIFEPLLALLDNHEGQDETIRDQARHNYSNALSRLGRADEAETVINTAIASKTRMLGATHPSTILSELTAAVQRRQAGDPEESARRLVDLLPRIIIGYGEKHPITAISNEALAMAILDADGDMSVAADAAQAAIDIRLLSTTPDEEQLAKNYELLGRAFAEQDRRADAVSGFRESIRWYKAIDEKHPEITKIEARIRAAHSNSPEVPG